MKNLIDLHKQIDELKRLVKWLIRSLITIAIIVPWSAIFLGIHGSITLGLLSILVSLIVVKVLKKKGIL
jgi:hypothetical protein